MAGGARPARDRAGSKLGTPCSGICMPDDCPLIAEERARLRNGRSPTPSIANRDSQRRIFERERLRASAGMREAHAGASSGKRRERRLTTRGGSPYGPPPFGRARSSGVEHLTFNQRVDGSIPSGLTNKFNYLAITFGNADWAGHHRGITRTKLGPDRRVVVA